MIVKDEEQVIERSLACAALFADEIIIADTGSADKTVELAKKFTDKIYRFDWCDDFSAARNFSFSKASCDLVMWLDADDVVEETDAQKIIALKKQRKDFDVAFLLYAAAFDGERPVFTYFRERIIRRSLGLKWEGAVHEAISARGRILYSDAMIRHKKVRPSDPTRNLNIYRKIISCGKALSPRDKFYYGRELMFCRLYIESAAVLENFLSGDGWSENKSEACLNLHAVYTELGDADRAAASLLRSFAYGMPKSRACCMLGDMFARKGDCETAIFWYKTAANLPQNIRSGAFVEEDFSGFIPFMQLCVLYDRLGDTEKANYYNELAGGIKPCDASYLHNKRYFENKLK